MLPQEFPTVETDGARVRQIVGNLLSNAIKYTKAGSVVLRVREYPAEIVGRCAGWVHFDVIDTGLGIPADKRDVIFEEFSRSGRPRQGRRRSRACDQQTPGRGAAAARFSWRAIPAALRSRSRQGFRSVAETETLATNVAAWYDDAGAGGRAV